MAATQTSPCIKGSKIANKLFAYRGKINLRITTIRLAGLGRVGSSLIVDFVRLVRGPLWAITFLQKGNAVWHDEMVTP